MKTGAAFFITVFFIFSITSCAGSGSDPVVPDTDTDPPVWTTTTGITDVLFGDINITIVFGEATDVENPPVSYLIYIDQDDNPWDQPPVEADDNDPVEFWCLEPGVKYWAGVRAMDSADPPNIDQNDVLISFTQEDHGWVRTYGGVGEDRGLGVSVDGDGNVYVTGAYSETVDFDPGPGEDIHVSNEKHNAYLSRFDRFGVHEWTRSWGGDGFSAGRAVHADDMGNVYVTGYFAGTVDMDPSITDDIRTSVGFTDISLTKFDSVGNYIWAITWGGLEETCGTSEFRTAQSIPFNCPGKEEGLDVGADTMGNVYVCGRFSTTCDFDPGPGVDTHSAVKHDAFLSSFDSSGDFRWAVTWGGAEEDAAKGLEVNGDGLVYVIGGFSDTVDFDPGPGEAICSGILDVSVSCFDPLGNLQWVNVIGGSQSDEGNGIAIDYGGDIYVTGSFTGSVDFDPGLSEDFIYGGDYGNSAWLSKYDRSGNYIRTRTWKHELLEGGYGVATSPSGDVYVCGVLGDYNGMDAFVRAFDRDGGFKSARTWGGDAWDWANWVDVDDSGNSYVIGTYEDLVDFIPGHENAEFRTYGLFDTYVLKLLPDCDY